MNTPDRSWNIPQINNAKNENSFEIKKFHSGCSIRPKKVAGSGSLLILSMQNHSKHTYLLMRLPHISNEIEPFYLCTLCTHTPSIHAYPSIRVVDIIFANIWHQNPYIHMTTCICEVLSNFNFADVISIAKRPFHFSRPTHKQKSQLMCPNRMNQWTSNFNSLRWLMANHCYFILTQYM